MRTTQPLSITLPIEMAEMVKAKVASGQYASESEVIRDGLRSMMLRDAALENWLQTEVVASIKEREAHPHKVISGDDMLPRFYARMALLDAETGDK